MLTSGLTFEARSPNVLKLDGDCREYGCPPPKLKWSGGLRLEFGFAPQPWEKTPEETPEETPVETPVQTRRRE